MNYKGCEITATQIKQPFVYFEPSYWIAEIDGAPTTLHHASEEEAINYAKSLVDIF